jgi:heme-degrading monooxygenase HmoA
MTSTTFRHDAITLHQEVSEKDFERFMREELVPYFNEAYTQSTRVTVAGIRDQFLLKDTEDGRNYLWVTVWDTGGTSPKVVRGSFEHTRMGHQLEKTVAMLKRLDTFGKRNSEEVFAEFSQK